LVAVTVIDSILSLLSFSAVFCCAFSDPQKVIDMALANKAKRKAGLEVRLLCVLLNVILQYYYFNVA
jgi:hypothetical protein